MEAIQFFQQLHLQLEVEELETFLPVLLFQEVLEDLVGVQARHQFLVQVVMEVQEILLPLVPHKEIMEVMLMEMDIEQVAAEVEL